MGFDRLAPRPAGPEAQVVLIVGQDDKAIPPQDGERGRWRKSRGRSVETIPHAGHLAHEEQPERVCELILDYAARSGGPVETHASLAGKLVSTSFGRA